MIVALVILQALYVTCLALWWYADYRFNDALSNNYGRTITDEEVERIRAEFEALPNHRTKEL